MDFEAPQAARTLGLVPFACILAALPLAASWEAGGASRFARGGLAAVAIGLVAWAGVQSWRTFFHVQPFDLGVKSCHMSRVSPLRPSPGGGRVSRKRSGFREECGT